MELMVYCKYLKYLLQLGVLECWLGFPVPTALEFQFLRTPKTVYLGTSTMNSCSAPDGSLIEPKDNVSSLHYSIRILPHNHYTYNITSSGK